jgi:SAM-dependent methyltransferase
MPLAFLVERYCGLPKTTRKPLWRLFHALLSRLDRDRATTFLNYGFAYPEGDSGDLALSRSEEKDRHAIQLYHHVTRSAALHGARVLEVGCGRGGGAAFLARWHRPAEYVAMDISAPTVALCNRMHRSRGLSFAHGEAEHLPFPADRFDVVINIESARCYGNLDAAFREVHRVLAPGGVFLLADMIEATDVARTTSLLSQAGLVTTHAEDIRANVLLAMQRDSDARRALVDAHVPAVLRPGFYEFSGVTGSNRYRDFEQGRFAYWQFEATKPGGGMQ